MEGTNNVSRGKTVRLVGMALMKTCSHCHLLNPEDTDKCPECGCVVFIPFATCPTCLNKQCYQPVWRGYMKRVQCPQCGEGETDVT